MLLGFTHFFGGQSQKRSKFSNLRQRLALGILRVNDLNTTAAA